MGKLLFSLSDEKSEISELSHQKALVKWAALNHITLVHIANEGKRSPSNGRNLRLAGLSRGFPDLLLPEARGGYFGLFLEVKRDKKYRPSEMKSITWQTQLAWIQKLNAAGYYASIVFGWEEGKHIIQHYMYLPETKKEYYDSGTIM